MNLKTALSASSGVRCGVRSIISHSGVANNDSHSALSQASPTLPIEGFINRISDLMMQEVLEGISEPISENRVWVEGEEAVFDPVRILRFLNRFGGGGGAQAPVLQGPSSKRRPLSVG